MPCGSPVTGQREAHPVRPGVAHLELAQIANVRIKLTKRGRRDGRRVKEWLESDSVDVGINLPKPHAAPIGIDGE
jgi:hypothetical protein